MQQSLIAFEITVLAINLLAQESIEVRLIIKKNFFYWFYDLHVTRNPLNEHVVFCVNYSQTSHTQKSTTVPGSARNKDVTASVCG